MNEKEILIALLSKAYNLDTERVAEVLYKKTDDGTATDEIAEEALNSILDLDMQRIAKFKEDAKVRHDNGYKKATLEVSGKWEKSLRDRFGVDGEGESILDALAERLEKGGKGADLADDAVKRHKLYRELELTAQQREEAARKEGAEALEAYKIETTKGMRRSQAETKAREILLAHKPVLEDDQTIAETRVRDFLRDLGEYEFDENLNPLKDGESYKNQHGHLVPFDALVREIAARRFKFQVSDPKGNGGNKNDPGANGGKKAAGTPKNEEELWTAYNAAETTEEKKAVLEAWEAANGEITV